jgi:hypothetical protein
VFFLECRRRTSGSHCLFVRLDTARLFVILNIVQLEIQGEVLRLDNAVVVRQLDATVVSVRGRLSRSPPYLPLRPMNRSCVQLLSILVLIQISSS